MTREHWGQHDDGCFGCKLATVQFGASCMPNRRSEAHRAVGMEHDREKNLGAYERLRKQGIQPASTAHAYELEKMSDSVHEIESGRRFGNPKMAKKVEAMMKDVPPPPIPEGLVAK